MDNPFGLRIGSKRYLIYDIDNKIPKKCRGCDKNFDNIGMMVMHEYSCPLIMDGIDNPKNSTCYRIPSSNKPLEEKFKNSLIKYNKLYNDYKSVVDENQQLKTESELKDLMDLDNKTYSVCKNNTNEIIEKQKLEIKELKFKLTNLNKSVNLVAERISNINAVQINGKNYYKNCCMILDKYCNIDFIKKGIDPYNMLMGILHKYMKEGSKDALSVFKILEDQQGVDVKFKKSIQDHYIKRLLKLKENAENMDDKKALENISRMLPQIEQSSIFL